VRHHRSDDFPSCNQGGLAQGAQTWGGAAILGTTRKLPAKIQVPAALTGMAGGGVTGGVCSGAGGDANAIRNTAETVRTIPSHQSGHAGRRKRCAW